MAARTARQRARHGRTLPCLNSAEDRTETLALDAGGRQVFSLAGRPTGRWLVQLSWEAGGQAYYVERAVQVP